jgi:capsule polysaccharide export protein KpsE/RkpR
MARNHPPLKLRRGTEAAILAANVSDFEVGEPIFAQDTGKLFIKTNAGTLEEISGTAEAAATWGQITGTLSNQTDLQNALNLKTDLTDFPQNNDGTLNIAQESTLQAFSSTLTTVQGNLAQTQADLDTAEATLASTAAITLTRAEASSGYLYFTTSGISGVPGTWSIQSPVFADPAVIDGGGADADQGD